MLMNVSLFAMHCNAGISVIKCRFVRLNARLASQPHARSSYQLDACMYQLYRHISQMVITGLFTNFMYAYTNCTIHANFSNGDHLFGSVENCIFVLLQFRDHMQGIRTNFKQEFHHGCRLSDLVGVKLS